jgi:hypothetical protein
MKVFKKEKPPASIEKGVSILIRPGRNGKFPFGSGPAIYE